MKRFNVLWVLNALITLLALLFFFAGLKDESVSSFNRSLWAAVLFVSLCILIGSLALYSINKIKRANLILLFPVLPGFIYSRFLLAVISFVSRWN